MGLSDHPARVGEDSSWPWPRQLAGLRRQLADPLLRNGYALMVNTGATGVLGLLYWLLVARLYRPADVGHASAAYVAMNLLAGIAALSFQGALTRFLPQAGLSTRRLAARSYAISVTASVCMTVIFLLAVGRLGHSYSEFSNWWADGAFTVSVAAWVLFTLQDSVLTGLRAATWVLTENGAFGVIKIALLVAFAAMLPHLGIYLSWMLPVFVAVPMVNAVIFGRLVPRHASLTAGCEPPSGRQIGRFLAGDYTGALAVLATTNLVPVLVASHLTPQATAYFFMAWAVGAVLQLLSVNMAASLTVEGSFDASTISANCRAALRRMAMIAVPCALLVVLLAHWGLSLFGAGYATQGTPVLIFLALGTLPQAAVELYLGVLRAQSAAGRVALVQGVRCAAILALTVALTVPFGITGAGVAFAVSQAATAALIAPGLWLAATGRARRPAGTPGGPDVGLALIPGLRFTPAQGGGAGGPAVAQLLHIPAPSLLPQGAEPARPSVLRWPAWLPATPTMTAIGTVAITGFGLFFWFLRDVSLPRMNGLGLISVLPAGSLAGVVLLSLALAAGIALPRAHPVLLGIALAGLTICLDGVTAIAETEPRFPTAYQIAGFTGFIAAHGHAAPGLDAYFSWPGFFAFMAYLAGVAGQHSLLTLLRVWPVAIDLLCLLPLFLIMRNLRVGWRARWLAGFFFTVGNWVGQDYFSPQAFNYLLYLVFVAICVNWFTRRSLPAPGLTWRGPTGWAGWLASRPWPRWLPWPDWLHMPGRLRPGRLHTAVFGELQPGEQPAAPAGGGQRAFLLALLIGIYAVAVTSHQLSPFYLLGACVALTLVRRFSVPGLTLLLAAMVAGWVSFAAVAYWSGHMADIFGGIGNIGGNVSVSVGGRMAGNAPLHRLALESRVLVAGVIMLLAFLGIVRRRLRHLDDRILIALLAMPVPSIAMQNYGGEMALRIYLFMLPAAAILGACFFFPGPRPGRVGWRAFTAVAVCAALLPLAFLVARYGNENFERSPAGELAAVSYIYRHTARGGSRVLWLSPAPATDVTPQMPWDYADLATVNFVPLKAPADPSSTAGLVSSLRRYGPGTYLIVPVTQVNYLQEADGYPAGWGRRLRASISSRAGVRVAFADPSAVVYSMRFPPGTAAHPPARSPAGPPGAGGLTTLGLAAEWLLLAVLAARAFTRVCAPAATRLLRPLTLAAWPLLVITAGIIVARFLVLR